MHFNLNHSLKQPKFINAECENVETEIPISSELINDCNFQSSMNKNETNFQYLEHLEVEFLNSIFNLKEAVLSVEETSAKQSSNYKEEAVQEHTSSEGLILKELLEHSKYAFLQPEKAKLVIISTVLTKLEEKKLLKVLKKYKEPIT